MAKKSVKLRSGPRQPPAAPVPVPNDATALVLDRLWAVILQRRGADPAFSHSARLLSRGTAKVAQKFGEEAVECLIEAVEGNAEALVAESADVLYHLLVVWVACGIKPAGVWAELERREGVSGIAEKAARAMSDGSPFLPDTPAKPSPKGVKSQPKGVKSQPKGVKSQPKGVKSHPKGAKLPPKATRLLSKSARSLPKAIKKVPLAPGAGTRKIP